MKKLLVWMAALVLVMGLAACSSGAKPAPVEEKPSDSKAENTGTGRDPTSFRVGAIYITSQDDTAGYTYQHHRGITSAMERLGMDPQRQLLVVDNVPEDDTQVSNAIDQLAGQGCDMIIGISYGYNNAMLAAAEKPEYADLIFTHATGGLSNGMNLNNYFGRIYQARYLTGIAAGLKSLELGNPSIGYVAAYNTEYAETASGINAFALGVQAVNPDAVVTVKTLNAWADETLERQTAQALVDGGSGVIAQHCDSVQPQLVAQEAGIFGCGYNSDMTEQAPQAHLTAAVWNWDVYYQRAIEAAMEGPTHFIRTMGQEYYGGLTEGMVDISPLNQEIAAPGTASAIEAVRTLITSHQWDVFSGVKLNITIDENGVAQVEQKSADLKDNQGNVIVKAGDLSLPDHVIKGTMDFNVEGVVAG